MIMLMPKIQVYYIGLAGRLVMGSAFTSTNSALSLNFNTQLIIDIVRTRMNAPEHSGTN